MNVQASIPSVTRTLGPHAPREYHGINWIGLWTLYKREVKRFWKIAIQTIMAPVVTTLLYMLVFAVAMRGARPAVSGVSYPQFIAPGLIMMGILNNAFANSSSSIMQAKMMGTSADFLAPPLSPFELVTGFTLGAATRGVMVGVVTALCVFPFARLVPLEPWAVVYYGVGSSLLMSLVGVLAGLWAEKFDQMAAVTNFVIMPLTFLSGTFYRVHALPPAIAAVSAANPFFYLIDGLRFGFIGHSDGSVLVGVLMTGGLCVVLYLWSWQLFRKGWRLKS